jgi:hypothetical protein
MKTPSPKLMAIVLLAVPMLADSATLLVENGELIGATGVQVNGRLYDVEFVDGSCIDLYGGCNSPSDFVFPDRASATLAAQALLDRVLIDGPAGAFDGNPRLTRGCEFGPLFNLCVMATPFDVNPERVFTMKAYNWSNGWDGLEMNAYEPFNDFADVYTTWAYWSAVPEPGTFVLLVCGLAGLGLAGKRRGAET